MIAMNIAIFVSSFVNKTTLLIAILHCMVAMYVKRILDSKLDCLYLLPGSVGWT